MFFKPTLLVAATVAAACSLSAAIKPKTTLPAMSENSVVAATVYDFTVKTLDGKEVNLGQYKGKKLLIVNTASECGFTPQYKDLEALAKAHGDKVTVLGFPANNFGGQEPGSNAEIATFCEKNYGVTFPMFSKISVKGSDAAPLYKFLADKAKNGAVNDAPSWNFCKYLVDESGHVVKYYNSRVNPMSAELLADIMK